jgi:predicted ABC-type ATPase
LIERVSFGVAEGGHNIPIDITKRRYVNGLNNLFELYLPIVDKAMMFDN